MFVSLIIECLNCDNLYWLIDEKDPNFEYYYASDNGICPKCGSTNLEYVDDMDFIEGK